MGMYTVSTQPSTLRGTVKWVPAKGQWWSAAGKVTAGLEESNGSLPPGGWLESPTGWLPVHQDQLPAQRSVTSMESLSYLFYTVSRNKGDTIFLPITSAKCGPIFTFLSPTDLAVNCSKQIIKYPTTPQMRRYITLWNITVRKPFLCTSTFSSWYRFLFVPFASCFLWLLQKSHQISISFSLATWRIQSFLWLLLAGLSWYLSRDLLGLPHPMQSPMPQA